MKELLSGLIGPVTGIINKVVPDKDEAARLAHEITTMVNRHAQELAVGDFSRLLNPRWDNRGSSHNYCKLGKA